MLRPGHSALALWLGRSRNGGEGRRLPCHFAAQLPELLRGVFYDGWNPSRVPVKFGPAEYVQRFARNAGIHNADVPRAASLVVRAVRRHVSSGALDEALDALPADLRRLVGPVDIREPAAKVQ